ncbi:hypothetical protein MKY41_10525 [Sporosarcina sp. FSL W7-1349]|uniref:hypothetical protein n=1 Tax=Sporosarcina sp. FSL W7-1349 TaxID=2921561 RepID=UPI0030FC26F4
MNKEILAVCFCDNTTRSNAERVLNQLFSFCAKPFDQIEEPDIKAWLNSMEEQGIPPYMIHSKIFAVQHFYQQCVEENVLKRNPSILVEKYKPEVFISDDLVQPSLPTSYYTHSKYQQ